MLDCDSRNAIEHAWADRREERKCFRSFEWDDFDFVFLPHLSRNLVDAATQRLHTSSDPKNGLDIGPFSNICALSNQARPYPLYFQRYVH